MKHIFGYVMACMAGGIFFSCTNDPEYRQGPEYDFAYLDILDTDSSGWAGGFADYPDSLADVLDFKVEYTQLDEVFQEDNRVLQISARNPHKDLFYYLTKKFEDLEPGTTYMIGVAFEVQAALLTDTTASYPLDVYFKMGASNIMPDTVLDISSNISTYKLNLNKGEGETVGSDFVYLGKPKNLNVGADTPQIIRNGDIAVTKTVETNGDGELWVTIGIDSEIAAKMAFSFNTVVVYFKEL